MLAVLKPCCFKLVNKCHHINKFTRIDRLVKNERLLKRWMSEVKQIKPNEDEEDEDKPIQYTTSKAHKEWKAHYNFRAADEEIKDLKIKHRAFSVSFFAVLIYFCFLREENDIDEELGKTLFERLPHLEKPFIEKAIHDHKLAGKDTAALEKRLKELENN
ncbi:hypothetical protein B4U80_06405 [Leptotrombidium deliense]|uniref:Uncharacterized protein n=1 Tax=Leptotrombidium deliense TaxID=299467 RepID=A0A443SIQ9_9ACAR|nr:hypothetical protein B4U80_06405 [Leptotrombidium deliense]